MVAPVNKLIKKKEERGRLVGFCSAARASRGIGQSGGSRARWVYGDGKEGGSVRARVCGKLREMGEGGRGDEAGLFLTRFVSRRVFFIVVLFRRGGDEGKTENMEEKN